MFKGSDYCFFKLGQCGVSAFDLYGGGIGQGTRRAGSGGEYCGYGELFRFRRI